MKVIFMNQAQTIVFLVILIVQLAVKYRKIYVQNAQI